MATLAITGVPLYHWNCTDLSKLGIKFTHIIEVDGRTLDRSNFRVARVTVSCDRVSDIPKEFSAVFGRQLCKIRIRVEMRLIVPKDPENGTDQ